MFILIECCFIMQVKPADIYLTSIRTKFTDFPKNSAYFDSESNILIVLSQLTNWQSITRHDRLSSITLVGEVNHLLNMRVNSVDEAAMNVLKEESSLQYTMYAICAKAMNTTPSATKNDSNGLPTITVHNIEDIIGTCMPGMPYQALSGIEHQSIILQVCQ